MRICDVVWESSDLNELRMGRTNVGTKTAPTGVSAATNRAALLQAPRVAPSVSKAYQSSIKPRQAPVNVPADQSVADKTLNQPLPAKPPKDPNAPSLAQRVGGVIGKVGKGIGAVAAVPQGIGRAVKKGYQAGVSAIGGPGAAQAPVSRPIASRTPATTQAGDDEIADLINKINRIDQRLKRAGISEQKKS